MSLITTRSLLVYLCYTAGFLTALPTTFKQSIVLPTNVTKTHVNITKYATFVPLSNSSEQPLVVPYVAASVMKNCSLLPIDETISDKIKNLLNDGTKLIKYNLHISNSETREFNGKNETLMYKPFFWIRSTGRHGTGLLLLGPHYDVLSLATLELGVETEDVYLKEHPHNCLNHLSYSDIEELIRELVMNDFQNTSSGEIVKLQPKDNICNMHVANENGTANFRFLCCQRSSSAYITCQYLEPDVWLNVLFVIMSIVKILVVLFCPRFIPDSMYRTKHTAAPFKHVLEPGKPLKINTVVTNNPDKFTNVRNRFTLSKFRHMPNFMKTIQSMLMHQNVPFTITLTDVCLRIKQDCLLKEDVAPVGLFKTLYDSFVKCDIRERPSLTTCCDADVLKPCFKKSLTWHRLLKESMKAVMLIALAFPWLVRVYVYFRFEHDEMHLRKSAAVEKELDFHYPGSMTLYLTPLHVLFITIYCMLSLESCVFGVLRRRTKEQFKFVLRKCFRDMREMSKIDVVGWLIRVVVKPCTVFGGLGICIGIIIWVPVLPVAVLILSFYLFPTLNLTFRLLAHFAVYMVPRNACSRYRCFARLSGFLNRLEKQMEMENISTAETLEKNETILSSRWYRFQQLLIITLCLISMYSVIFLVVEFLSFVVEICVYTMMGLILNASTTLTYISFVLLLCLYGFECLGSVGKRFLAFNKTMHTVVLGLGKEKVERVVYQEEARQKNRAFIVKTERNEVDESPVKLTKSSEGYPRWQISRLLLFLSKNDKPLIPKRFYFKSCRMPFYSVPGELLISYLKATMEFSVIIIFLMFVLVVVMAFGDTYEVSATNKLIATSIGGFLPFMLRKFLFKSHAVAVVDTSNISFQVCFKTMLDEYEECWPIFDITVVDPPEVLRKYDVISDQPRSEIVLGNGNSNRDVPETPVFEESEPFISKNSSKKDATPIDLLIEIRGVDLKELPVMQSDDGVMRNEIGSVSMLD